MGPNPTIRSTCLTFLCMAVLCTTSHSASTQETVVVPDPPAAVAPAPRIVVPAQPVAPATPAPLKGIVRELRNGPLLIHGNFCGVGNRRGTQPVDPLDAACMRHDACTRTGTLPGCACNERLRVEATLVAEDPRTPPEERAVAAATVAAMSVLICKTGGTLAVPIPSPLR